MRSAWVWCFLIVSGCAKPAPPSPAEPIAAATPIESAPTTSGQDINPKVAETTRDAAADALPSAPVVKSDPKVFGCGTKTCSVGHETCCGSGSEGVCTKSVPDDAPRGQIGYLKTQFEVCGKITFQNSSSFDHIDRCDESADCAGRELCCDQFLFSGGTLAECTAPLPDGATPCDFGERCVEGSRCRLPDTVCTRGICRKKPPAKRTCGSEACSGDAVCCGDPLGCAPESACFDHARVFCTQNSDCIKGERCVYSSRGTACIRITPDPEHTRYVCQRSADCPNKCTVRGAKPRCVESGLPFIKACECPEPP